MRISGLLMMMAGVTAIALACASQVDPVVHSPELESVESPMEEDAPDAAPANPSGPAQSADGAAPGPPPGEQELAAEPQARIAGLVGRSACALIAEVREDVLESRHEMVNGTKYYRPKRLTHLEVRERLRGGASCPDEGGELFVRYPYHSHSLRILVGRTYLFVLSGIQDGVGMPLYDADHSAIPITPNGLVQGLNITPRDLLAEEATP